MALVIRKKVSLDFLGKEYEAAYLVFRAIPLRDYEKIIDATPKEGDNKASLRLIVDSLKTYFMEGKFPAEKGELQDLTKDDIDELDAETAIKCFQQLSGGEISPKVEVK